MSINTEINLLKNTKEELCVAIMEKGVIVSPNDLFSTYPTRISQIPITSGDKDNLFRTLIEKTETELIIPEGTTTIENSRFINVITLTSVTIPSSVNKIEQYAFNGCTSLQSITCLAIIPPILSRVGLGTGYILPFDNTNNCPIYVPEESVDAYKTAWPTYASRIKTHTIEFKKVTSTNEITSGKYLIVWENGQQSKALSSYLLQTTIDEYSGLNSEDSTYGVTVKEDSTIEVNDTLIDFVAADYDSANGTLSWTNSGITYYISEFDGSTFDYGDIQTIPDTIIAPSDATNRFTFMSGNGYHIGYRATKDKFGWYSRTATARFTNIALYKLIEN